MTHPTRLHVTPNGYLFTITEHRTNWGATFWTAADPWDREFFKRVDHEGRDWPNDGPIRAALNEHTALLAPAWDRPIPVCTVCHDQPAIGTRYQALLCVECARGTHRKPIHDLELLFPPVWTRTRADALTVGALIDVEWVWTTGTPGEWRAMAATEVTVREDDVSVWYGWTSPTTSRHFRKFRVLDVDAMFDEVQKFADAAKAKANELASA